MARRCVSTVVSFALPTLRQWRRVWRDYDMSGRALRRGKREPTRSAGPLGPIALLKSKRSVDAREPPSSHGLALGTQ